MKKILVFCMLLSLWLSLNISGVWAIDVGWMQKGVRVWYFGSAGSVMSSDAAEAYLLGDVSGSNAQVTRHSGLNHWASTQPIDTSTYSFLDQGPFWIHPTALQAIAVGDSWMGIEIATMNRTVYTYTSFKNNAEFSSLPYLLLPIKTLFELKNQREVVRLVYGIPYLDDVWGTAYFDAETGLCLFNLRLTFSNTVWFLLSEINYDFAAQAAFAEDNGPHTGFKSNIIKTSITSQYIMMQSSVETRYGNTVQMWTSTSAGGSGGQSYLPPNENYCFFGDVPVLRNKLMSATPQYPPENWTAYGEYLWWWVPQEALQKASINIFNVPLERTSTAPYTFETAEPQVGLYFSKIIFDNDGYMTDFSALYSTIGLNVGLGTAALQPIHLVEGLSYYKNSMERAVPAGIRIQKDGAFNYYPNLQDAYNAAENGDIIQAQATAPPEDPLTFPANIAVSIKGGYDSLYATNAGTFTTINGSITIRGGAVTLENLLIK